MTNLIRQQAIQGFKQGDSFICKRTVTREEILSFGDMTRDYNPVHFKWNWLILKKNRKGFI
ncbi:MAG: hypothetical protein JRE64_24830 [Deltaproteobacteria bacterium]|nr:hypothetical protein [Deltaproteobacteria bacterium]